MKLLSRLLNKLPLPVLIAGELAIDLVQEARASRKARNAALAAQRAEASRRYQQASNAAGSVSQGCAACELECAHEARGGLAEVPGHTCGRVVH